jgi:hypothetical protein
MRRRGGAIEPFCARAVGRVAPSHSTRTGQRQTALIILSVDLHPLVICFAIKQPSVSNARKGECFAWHGSPLQQPGIWPISSRPRAGTPHHQPLAAATASQFQPREPCCVPECEAFGCDAIITMGESIGAVEIDGGWTCKSWGIFQIVGQNPGACIAVVLGLCRAKDGWCATIGRI